MNARTPQISLETLIGVAPMLGHILEDRHRIRDQQDSTLLKMLQTHTSVHLREASQQHLFCVAPFDVLVTRIDGRKRFHMLEINGTGIGGLSNMTVDGIEAVLDGLSAMAEYLEVDDPLLLVASSGKENDRSPRPNRLLHEKILYVEALRRGFEKTGRAARVLTMTHVLQDKKLPATGPVLVLGYLKELLSHLRCDDKGQLWMFDRRVHGAINDRFCLNVLHRFHDCVDLGQFHTLNRCFRAGGDKGFTYELWNEYHGRRPHPLLDAPVRFEHASDRHALLHAVLAWLRAGRKPVIKPQGTGHGDGIEFFLDPCEDERSIAGRIDASTRLTESLYRLEGGAFPYTVCDFVDTLAIDRPGHPLSGHKYELRIPVYRDGMLLRAFPSIIKISSEKYDAAKPSHLSLINNISASSHAKSQSGIDFMLPLANRDTWELIGVSMDEMMGLCSALTGFTRYLLDQVQDRPERFGLPSLRKHRSSRALPTYS